MKFQFPIINQFVSILALNVTNTLFQLILIPILINHTATNQLGPYFLALSFSVLASIFVNFGTSQTSVVEIKKAANENERHTILVETLALRFLPLCIGIIISCLLPILINNGIYYLLVLPIIIAEFINPQFYLIAIYKINRYTFLNFILRAVVIIAIIILKDNKNLIEITLLGTGFAMLALNIIYLPFTFLKERISPALPSFKKIKELYSTHILVVGNGLTVHLQQSMFLFALPSFVTPIFLSAYGLIDKLISSFRMLVNTYSSSVMPHAATHHQMGFERWKIFKQQQNRLLFVLCLAAGVIMYIFPEQLLTILFLGKNNNQSFFSEAMQLVKIISPVPLLIALNVLNVSELILEKKFLIYLGAGLLVLLISLFSIDALKLGLPAKYAGYYPVVIEGACLLIYSVIVQKIRNEQSR